jgi:hypothetical protein
VDFGAVSLPARDLGDDGAAGVQDAQAALGAVESAQVEGLGEQTPLGDHAAHGDGLVVFDLVEAGVGEGGDASWRETPIFATLSAVADDDVAFDAAFFFDDGFAAAFFAFFVAMSCLP